MARRLSPGVSSRSAAGAAVAASWVLALAPRTTDDLAFSTRPLAVHAGCRFGRLGIGVQRLEKRRPPQLPGFSHGDRFMRSNCSSVSLRSHMIENVLDIAAPAE
jgi:hypothetical protein